MDSIGCVPGILSYSGRSLVRRTLVLWTGDSCCDDPSERNVIPRLLWTNIYLSGYLSIYINNNVNVRLF